MNIVKLMNEFTKEELKLIIDKLGLLRFSQFEGCGKLVKKIDEMINNYDAEVIEVWHCEKCGHVQ